MNTRVHQVIGLTKVIGTQNDPFKGNTIQLVYKKLHEHCTWQLKQNIGTLLSLFSTMHGNHANSNARMVINKNYKYTPSQKEDNFD